VTRTKRGISLALLLATLAFSSAVLAIPSSPTDLTAAISGSTVALAWTAGTGGVIMGYRLEAGTAPGLSNIASSLVGPTTGFTATSVPPGTYYVRVRAVAADGESAPSNEVIVIVGAGGCVGPPDPPAGLSTTVNGSFVTLDWATSGGCGATNYILFAGSGPGLSDIAIVNLGLTTSFSASAPAGTFYVRVVAQNAFGSSGLSNEVWFTIGSFAWLWVKVVDESGVCIDGATIQVVRGQRLGPSITQETPCNAWSVEGGVFFRDLTPGVEMTLRASASGRVALETTVIPTSGPIRAILLTPSRIQ
jgi:hypothetical protein